jgi:hypothetical protein
MAITDAQKVDYLYKKIGAGVAKTDTSSYKSPSNEANASPILTRGDTIWQQSVNIPATLPVSNSSVVTVYADAVSSTIECVLDGTVSGTNRTWLTNRQDWIGPEFGATYQVKVYAAPTGWSNVQTAGTQLFSDGSGNNDSWFFDYQAGILNFPDTNVPTALSGKKIYVTGVRYTGQKGLSNFPDGITVDSLTVTNNTLFSGNVAVSGTMDIDGNTTILANLYVAGNINVTGNTNTISGNIGQFFGDANGFGALYSGIPTGYVYQPQTVLQASTDYNGYAQVNHQNINSGDSASTDFVATADNGDADQGYIDMGINGSGHVPDIGDELNQPNDGYLYVHGVGNTSDVVGNLLLGTIHNTDVIITTNGFGSVNEQARFKNNVGLIIARTTSSTNTTSGALQVAGGAGIQGNLNVGGTIATSEFYGNIHADVITPLNSNVVSINSIGALQVPVGDTSQRPAGADGYIRYNTDTPALEYFDGSIWVPVTNTVTDQIITGTGTDNVFTLDQGATTVGVIVSINGTLQQPTTAYSVSGNQITFTETPESTDIIDIRFLGASVTINSTLSDDLTISGNVTLSGILSAPPTTKASNAPGTVGQICWDDSWIYVCTATNTWKRSPLTGGY